MAAIRIIRLTVVCLSVLSISGATAMVSAQSLADLAKKEEERRKETGDPKKVYTNKDLKGGAEPRPQAGGDAAKDAADPGKAKASEPGDKAAEPTDKAAADADAAKDPTKTPAYWSGKLKALKDKLEQDTSFADALQTKINALTTDFVNRDDPFQRAKIEKDRQKALADVARLTKAIADDQKAITDFEERARTSGIPAGWLR
jgi:hypothetical protein